MAAYCRATLVVVVVVVLVLFGTANAKVTWNVVNRTTNVELNLAPRDFVDPYSEEALTCRSPGTCVPATQFIPLQTVFSWCGWKTMYRSLYNVSVVNPKTDANFSVVLMREPDWNVCSQNLSNFMNCRQVAFSLCDTQSSCLMTVNGLIFPHDMCLLIAVNGNLTKNKNKTGANIQFTFHNYYESPRYYGTVFSIIFTIFIFGTLLVYLLKTCWSEYHAPNDRIYEYRSLESSLMTGELAGGVDNTKEAATERKRQNLGNFYSKVSGAMEKVRKTFRRKGLLTNQQ